MARGSTTQKAFPESPPAPCSYGKRTTAPTLRPTENAILQYYILYNNNNIINYNILYLPSTTATEEGHIKYKFSTVRTPTRKNGLCVCVCVV